MNNKKGDLSKDTHAEITLKQLRIHGLQYGFNSCWKRAVWVVNAVYIHTECDLTKDTGVTKSPTEFIHTF